MKKTIFLSLVAGAVIFSGCGGGGGGDSTSGGTTSGGTTSGGSTSGGTTSGGTTSGGTTSGGSTSGGTTSGGTTSGGSTSGGAATYSPFVYPADTLDTANMITVNADGKRWTVAGDTRALKEDEFALDKTYPQAERYCADNNLNLPSANDLLSLPTPAKTTALWAKGKFIVFYSDDTIGQNSDQQANTEVRKVICMEGDSIEKKHQITENDDDTITDVVTGLTWSPFRVYDKNTLDEGHANQSRFPIANPTAPNITAEEYCTTLGAEWRLPSYGELRTIMYLDGTTPVKKLDNIVPTNVWTSTKADDGRNYVIRLNQNSVTGIETGDTNASDYMDAFVTCVK